MRLGNRRPQRISGLPRVFRDDIKHPPFHHIVQDRNVVVPFTEALLIESDVAQPFQRAPIKTTRHGALHDAVDLVPGERGQPLGLDFAAYRLQDLNGKGLKEFGKAGGVRRPRRPAPASPARGAVDARDVSRDERLPRHRVEMPPAPGPTAMARNALSAARADQRCLRSPKQPPRQSPQAGGRRRLGQCSPHSPFRVPSDPEAFDRVRYRA